LSVLIDRCARTSQCRQCQIVYYGHHIAERCGGLPLQLNYKITYDAWQTLLLLINAASTMPSPDLTAVPSNGSIHKCHSIMGCAIVSVLP